MTIEKLHSGSYRITQMSNGTRYRVTVDHKPTKDEAVRLMAKELEKEHHTTDTTFGGACERYMQAKSNVLSPSTISGYRSIIRRLPERFMKLPLMQIKGGDVQLLVNEYAANHSPKTTINVAGFITAVLSFHEANIRPPKLPQKKKSTAYIPTTEDIRRILDYAKGTPYEVAFTLAAFGLRRSEILAVTSDKLSGNTLTIDTALVQNEHKEWVDKGTKTTESTRTIIIPAQTADLIRQSGVAYGGSPKMLNQTLQRFQDKLGIPHFSLHKMRHFFASYMHQQGYTDSQIQAAGGWKTDNIMKSVYRHAMDMDKAKVQMCESMEDDLLNEIPSKTDARNTD